jgi:hypothetical protein
MMEENEDWGAPGVTLREQVEDLREQAREDTMRLAADVRAQVAALVRRRQDLLADRLGGIATALRDAGRRLLREADRPSGTVAGSGGATGAAGASGMPPLAGPAPARVDAATRGICELTERAAQQVDRASRYLRQNEVRDLVRDLEEQARQRPLLLVGGSFATGLLLARFFKSSSERAAWSDSDLPSTPHFESGGLEVGGQLSEAMAERW